MHIAKFTNTFLKSKVNISYYTNMNKQQKNYLYYLTFAKY